MIHGTLTGSVATLSLSVMVLLVAMVATPVYSSSLVAHHPGQTVIRTKGSDTMHVLMRAWADAYHKDHPSIVITTDNSGSSNGIAALVNGHIDMAVSSRTLKQQELRRISRQAGLLPQEHIVGWDGLSVVVHRHNPVEGFAMEQLASLYARTGTLKSWSDVGVTVPGCETGQIMLGSRRNNSGSYAFLQDAMAPFNSQRQRMASGEVTYHRNSRQLADWVASNPCAIGYMGMALVTEHIRAICIRTTRGECLPPTAESIRNRTYPLTRPLYLYVPNEPTEAVQHYLNWIRGTTGQHILRQVGFIPAVEQP
ncbi:MAG: phosphate ABC transporter substrate-binding protein [Magnetococcales bacterium]|nr:phosphate ABC transporter substrate-binding protein [Magnetococcales bacterium]